MADTNCDFIGCALPAHVDVQAIEDDNVIDYDVCACHFGLICLIKSSGDEELAAASMKVFTNMEIATKQLAKLLKEDEDEIEQSITPPF